MGTTWTIRDAVGSDEDFLRDMLRLALFVPEGEDPVPDSVVDEPELARYVESFGERFGDIGVIATVADRSVGACWLRLFSAREPGYGFVSEDVPELSIAVVAEHRGRGLGTELIEVALRRAADADFERVSLSVDERSPALDLYERLGFEHVGWQGTSLTMTRPTLNA